MKILIAFKALVLMLKLTPWRRVLIIGGIVIAAILLISILIFIRDMSNAKMQINTGTIGKIKILQNNEKNLEHDRLLENKRIERMPNDSLQCAVDRVFNY